MAAEKLIIRTTAIAVISAGLATLVSSASFAGETPVSIAQAEPSHLHQHPPATTEAVQHDHEGTDRPVRVGLQTDPATLRAGSRAELTFAFNNATGQPVEELLTHHARQLHVVIASEDMNVLGHIHPQDFGETIQGGLAKTYFTFPQAGRYVVAVDFMTAAQGSQDEQFVVEVKGTPGASASEPEVSPGLASVRLEAGDRYTEPAILHAVDEHQAYAVSLQQPEAIRAGEAASFDYRFTRNGEPLTELRPYLDAPLHLAVVKDDLTAFLHTHGTLPENKQTSHSGHRSAVAGHGNMDTAHDKHGPAETEHGVPHINPDPLGSEIEATVTFPEPGTYYLFAQAAHGDQLLISRFPVHVE